MGGWTQQMDRLMNRLMDRQTDGWMDGQQIDKDHVLFYIYQ